MKWWILFLGLLGVAVWDWYKKEIFLPALAGFTCIGLFFAMGNSGEGLKAALFGVLPGGVLLFVSFVTKGAIGEGDGWLLAAIGVFTGAKEAWLLLLLSASFVMLVGVVLIGCKKANRKTRLPWAPFAWCAYMVLWIGGILA